MHHHCEYISVTPESNTISTKVNARCTYVAVMKIKCQYPGEYSGSNDPQVRMSPMQFRISSNFYRRTNVQKHAHTLLHNSRIEAQFVCRQNINTEYLSIASNSSISENLVFLDSPTLLSFIAQQYSHSSDCQFQFQFDTERRKKMALKWSIPAPEFSKKPWHPNNFFLPLNDDFRFYLAVGPEGSET